MRVLIFIFTLALTQAMMPACALAAVNCTLEHPDRDIKRLVKDSTTYRVRELIPFRHGKKDLLKSIARTLDSELDPEFESGETPYTFYAVYKGNENVALVLGTTARVVAGPMQLFVVYARKGGIQDIFVQKISSKDAPAFRSKFYREQYFKFGINSLPTEADVRPPIRSPSNDTIRDHHSFLRAVRFNILLVKELYNNFKE
ncbi:MAG: hypothetical protein HY074_02430 [Deltaproteobacteria bacterium]|nr:hypothetical protein [Deltaproteobacteria bacterium]